jgi:hypothetical protein
MAPETRAQLRAGLRQRLRVPADPSDHRRRSGGQPVLTGAPPQALRLTPVTIEDRDVPGGSYVRHDFDVQFSEDTNPAGFFLFLPRIEIKRPPASEAILRDSDARPADARGGEPG